MDGRTNERTDKSENKSSELKMTHQATANRWPLSAHMMTGVAALFCFSDGRTDTTHENNDHLFGRGLVGQLLLPLAEVSI